MISKKVKSELLKAAAIVNSIIPEIWKRKGRHPIGNIDNRYTDTAI